MESPVDKCSFCGDTVEPSIYSSGWENQPNAETTKRKTVSSIQLCSACGHFCTRWRFTEDFEPRDMVLDSTVAEFAKSQRHASWIVWDINQSRKTANSRSRRNRLKKIEKRRQHHDGLKISATRPQFRLLSLRKVLELCKAAGKA